MTMLTLIPLFKIIFQKKRHCEGATADEAISLRF